MIGQVGETLDRLPGGPVALIGSSLGAFVAVQVALARPARIDRLVLLAPALDFGGNRMQSLGRQGLELWRQSGHLPVFHYGVGRMMSVHYELYADACRYDCVGAAPTMPIQIFQGRRDAVVDPAGVAQWAKPRPNVELHLLDDDHQLGASHDVIWAEAARFLQLR